MFSAFSEEERRHQLELVERGTGKYVGNIEHGRLRNVNLEKIAPFVNGFFELRSEGGTPPCVWWEDAPMTTVPMRFPQTSLLWSVDDVYSETECAEFVANIEQWGCSIATNNPIYRNQDRVIRDDPETAAELFTRLRAHVPATIGELVAYGLNERLRFYRYIAGQEFKEHMDHWYQPSPTEISLLSVLVYFNGDFEGGETRFTEQLEEVVVPAPGRVAIFQHKIRHEGCRLVTGAKYAMRTDVMYRAKEEITLTYT